MHAIAAGNVWVPPVEYDPPTPPPSPETWWQANSNSGARAKAEYPRHHESEDGSNDDRQEDGRSTRRSPRHHHGHRIKDHDKCVCPGMNFLLYQIDVVKHKCHSVASHNTRHTSDHKQPDQQFPTDHEPSPEPTMAPTTSAPTDSDGLTWQDGLHSPSPPSTKATAVVDSAKNAVSSALESSQNDPEPLDAQTDDASGDDATSVMSALDAINDALSMQHMQSNPAEILEMIQMPTGEYSHDVDWTGVEVREAQWLQRSNLAMQRAIDAVATLRYSSRKQLIAKVANGELPHTITAHHLPADAAQPDTITILRR